MKKSCLYIPLLIVSLSICGCSGTKVSYKDHLDDYIQNVKFEDNFSILQLTDIHWSCGTDTISSKQYLKKVIAEADIKAKEVNGRGLDLLELTGDLFMLSNAQSCDQLLAFFEETGIPYATTWGNHDREGQYNPNWLSQQFLNAEHSLYTEVDYDDVYGRSNYMINLTVDGTSTGAVKWQIANLDSGASYSETVNKVGRTYDYIRPNQAEWYVAENAYAVEKSGGNSVPVIGYYHIAQKEFTDAYNDIKENGATYKNAFFKEEEFGSSSECTSDFFEAARVNGLKAFFVGHAHNVDWTVDYKGVTMGFGVKSGTELYYAHIDENNISGVPVTENFDLIGASMVTLHDDGTFDLDHLYYNERSTADYVNWVRY